MTIKKFKTVKLLVVMAIAIIFAQAIVYQNWLMAAGAFLVASVLLFYLRTLVPEVMTDERDYATGGKAALLAMRVYSYLAIVAILVLFAQRDFNPAYEPMALTLAYSTCFLMLIYALVFRYYDKIIFSQKKVWSMILISLLLAVIIIFGIRFFSGEDNWICQNGQWIQHGHPSFPVPSRECK